MQSKIIVGDKAYCSSDEPLKLLMVLRSHFERNLERESTDGQVYKLVAALGRAPDGQTIVWHPPLPWPFDFENESRKVV
jgi:hypothetical protein